MFDHNPASPQEEFNKKLRKREKKLRERLLEIQEEQARAQKRLQRAEARLQKRLARVQRLEAHLATIKQHHTEPIQPVGSPLTTETEPTQPVGPQFIAPATPTPAQTTQPVGARFSAPAVPQPVPDETAPPQGESQFIAPPTPEQTTTVQEPAPEPEPSLGTQFIAPPTTEQAQNEAIPLEEASTPLPTTPPAPTTTTQQSPALATALALPPWAQQEPPAQTIAISPEVVEEQQPVGAPFIAPPTPEPTPVSTQESEEQDEQQERSLPAVVAVQAVELHDANREDTAQVEQPSELTAQAEALRDVSTSDGKPQVAIPLSPESMSEAAPESVPAPVDMDEEAGYGPSLDELLQSNEQDYEPQAPSVLETATAVPTSTLSPQLPEAHDVPLDQAEETAHESRAVVEATEQNTRLAADRAFAVTELAQEAPSQTSETASSTKEEASIEPLPPEANGNTSETAVSTQESEDSARNNLLSPELASFAKPMSIASIDEEEEEVEMLTSTMVADAAAAAAAEAEAAAEASSARTREARRTAQEAELMLAQVRMAIERGILRGEDAEAALRFTEREATRAHAVLIDAETAEEQAVRAAMNAEAEAEVAEGMSFAISKRNADEHVQSEDDKEDSFKGILLDELPDDDETVEIPIIQPRENQ